MRTHTVVIVFVLVLLAAAAAYLARPRIDQWWAGRSGSTAVMGTPPLGGAAKGKYQCSMHPQIVSDEPGICPICQMKLTRVDEPVTAPEPRTATAAAGSRKPLFYRHPMRPDVTSPAPAKDEMGMDYIPVYEEEPGAVSTVAGRAGFTLSTERQQLIGVTRAPVGRRQLDSEIRTVGIVAYDPALYQAIVEYREALTAQRQFGTSALPEALDGAKAIARAAALRLRQLGLSEQQVREVTEVGGNPVHLLLPSTSMWVYAQVYEYEMNSVRAGQTATITTPADRGRTYSGRVVNVDPIIDPKTRTARARIHVPTPDASLRPEAFVQATIHVPSQEVLAVPADAVLLAGKQQIVFVIVGEGTFEPRAVRLGRQAGEYYEVLDGLREGEEVVTSANFLIDSESRFRAALAAFSKKMPGSAGGPPAVPDHQH
jgi:Cu(I)/Ag(I) efflux system membrane fusion protein